MRRQGLMLVALMLVISSVGCQKRAAKPPRAIKVPVTTELIAAAPFQANIGLLGRVVPAGRIELRAPVPGRIFYGGSIRRGSQGLQGLRTGQLVEKGQLLFRIESPDFDLRLSEAELAAQSAKTELDRARKGVEAGILPTADLEARQIDASLASKRLANARAEHERLSVFAPSAGRLKVQRAVAEGTELSTDILLAELAAEGAARVEVWVPAGELDRLTLGLTVECRVPGATRPVGVGTLVEIAQEVELGGVARAVVEIHEDLAMPRFGEGVDLRVLLAEKPEAMTVPRRSVVIRGHVSSIFILEKVGKALKARSRLVLTGGRDGERIEILDGLKAGDRVAVEGAEYLADGLMAEDVGSEATGSEATGSEATGSEATGSEATGSEATGSEATGSEATGSEATGSKGKKGKP